MQVEWYWLILAFFAGLAFGIEEGQANKKKKQKSDE